MKKIKVIMLLILTLCVYALYAGYYDTATGNGDTLKGQLRTIITNGHTPLSYDGAKLKLFQNVFNVDGVVRCVYTGQDFAIASGYNGSSSPNTEHSYCQSWFGTQEPSTKKSDLHHLFPTVQNVNSSRGNMPFGIVTNHTTATTYASNNNFHSYRGDCSNGVAVFEPSDQFKGDIARGLLYFSVRYNMGLTIDNVDMLPYLLQWTSQDPVDSFEQSRNEKNYTFQGNRNPFIDHPEWIASIWQNSEITNTQITFDINSALTHEGKNTYYLAVRINNPSESNPTSCRVAFNSGSASAINNFTYQDITFPADNSTTQFIPITITDNNIVDGSRNITFALQNVSGGNSASTGTNSQFTLTVEDNDFTETATNYTSDLIISEYIEGSSNNKYIEIFNGTGTNVNLSDYKINIYSNGSTTPSSITMTGTLAHNSCIVYANNSALNPVNGIIPILTGTLSHNGDDALALFKMSTNQYVDIFGRIGEDPGAEWVSGTNSTADNTLVRNNSIKSGISVNPSSGFPTLLSEWTCYNTDDFSHLGSHDMDFGIAGENSDTQAQLNIAELDTDYHFGNNTALTLNFVDMGGSGKVKIKKYNTGLLNPEYSTTNPEFVSQNRWVISKENSIVSFNVSLKITLNELSNNDITNLNDIKIYSRPTVGSGIFSCLGLMTYNSSDNTLSIDNISSFSEFILCSDSQTLPVTLSSFTAFNVSNTNNVQINWITESESNLIGYKVFRNTDNNLENSLSVSSIINANNSSNQSQYSFLDNDLQIGDYYYWLYSYERNGSTNYYGPVSVSLTIQDPETPATNEYQTGIVSVYPNPFNPSVNISYYLDIDTNCEISFYNSKGQLVDKVLPGLQIKGLHAYNWKPSHISSGLYFVKFKSYNNISTKRILLLK